jgi:hypothetical protein
MIDKRKLRPVFKKVLKKYFEDEKKPSISDIVARVATMTLNGKDNVTYHIVDFEELIYFVELAEKELYGNKKKK